MRIAFDLDDTLIPCGRSFPVESPTRWARWLRVEPLRQGSVALLRELRRLGCDTWVYTTSLRSPFSVWLQFWCYGLRLGGFVNQDRHCAKLRSGWPAANECSKYPPAFGIDLIVDDSEGVLIEGRQFRFSVVHVRPDEETWAERILKEVSHRLGR
jgi:hypothetical protein